MRITYFLFLILLSTATYAQQLKPVTKAEQAKTAATNAFGGYKAIKEIRHFSYTIIKTTYSPDTVVTRTACTLDLKKQYIQEIQYTATDTITRWIGEDGAWQLSKFHKTILSDADKVRLQRVFLTNFIPMLQNDSLVYEYKAPAMYKGQKADIVQVYLPQKKALIMDLFIATESGKVLTTSKPNPETGNYLYFADELDYQPIGRGVIFPLVYQVWVKGKLVTEGKFADLKVKR